jgi:superfamily II DNA or RNA helicase
MTRQAQDDTTGGAKSLVMALCGDVDDATLSRNFSRNALRRGLDYANGGRVAGVEVSDDGHAIKASALGSSGSGYWLSIQISHARDGRLRIASQCSCPVRFDCKHAAGALYVALGERDEGDQDSVRRADVARWLTELDRTSKPRPGAPDQQLVYHLFAEARNALGLETSRYRRRADGAFDFADVYPLERIVTADARMIAADDVTIALLLTSDVGNRQRLRSDLLANAVDVILRTGRAFWQPGDIPLRRGAPRSGTVVWKIDADGLQRMDILVAGAPATFVLVRGPWYIDTATGEMGELELGIDRKLAELLLSAPPLSDAETPNVAATLGRLGLAPPATSVTIRTLEEPPANVLSLELRTYRDYRLAHRGNFDVRQLSVAQLKLRYGTHEVAPNELGEDFRDVEDGVLVVRRRDRAAEKAAVERLARCGMVRFHSYHQDGAVDAGTFAFSEPRAGPRRLADPWTAFVLFEVPRLREDGWTVEIDEDFPARVVLADEPITIDLSGSVSSAEFELDVTIDVDGQRVFLVPMLVEALRASPHLLADGAELAVVGSLPDGRGLAVPAERLRKIVGALVEIFDAEPGSSNVTLARALSLTGLEGEVRIEGSALRRVRDAARALRGDDEATIVIPQSLRAELRPYQRDGLRWLQRLRALGFGGILADSMGLGKTVQTLAHLLAEHEAGRLDRPALVVAPTSVVPNWQAEVERFAPSLRTVVLHGADRAQRHPEIAAAHLVVTSYALLLRDRDVLLHQPWHVAVLDEAQNIKNADAKTAQVARQLDARQRLALTGTPVENHLGELWSLFAYAEPAVLGERKSFNRNFRAPIERDQDAVRSGVLGARIAPFVLRRAKQDVARELPPKTEIVRTVAFGTAQRDFYETIRAAMNERVRSAIAERGLARSSIVVLDALLKLRQACCDPRLVKAGGRSIGAGAKIGMLMSMLDELMEDGRRILLFSQFTSMLALIEDELRGKEVPYVTLTGDTKDRATPVRRFQDGEIPLFLISLKAGGTGLNLTAADTVIHYDPWWNPAVEQQATDRAHRIGQEKAVFVYKLVCEQTIEERIIELQARKGALASALLDGERSAVPLDAEEIAHLFE